MKMKTHTKYLSVLTLAMAGPVSAQSSVTLYGVVDAAIQHIGGSVSSVTRLKEGALSPSRLGFRGTEDLGGGLSASFWLEAGLSNDSGSGQPTNINNQATGAGPAGSLAFNRRSTVSLAGSWGELRLGRDYTPTFWNYLLVDPFNLVGVGTNQSFNSAAIVGPYSSAASVRTSNGIGYFLPRALGGVYGQVQFAMGENPSGGPTEDDGRVAGLRLGYAAGAFDIAVAASRATYAAGDTRAANIGASYNFGPAKLLGGYYRNSVDGAAASSGRGSLIGTVVPMGVGEVHASLGTFRADIAGSPKSTKLSLGYQHNLSKRTAIYTTMARVKNSGGATQTVFGPSGPVSGGAANAPNASSSGFDVGIRHAF